MSIYFIQEAHCTEDNVHDWRAEWAYQALFSCCSSSKAGVAILLNNNFSFQISRTYTDPEGRFIICDLITKVGPLKLVAWEKWGTHDALRASRPGNEVVKAANIFGFL